MDLKDRMWATPALKPYCPPLTDATQTVVQWIDRDGNVVDTQLNEPSRYPNPS